MPQDPEPTTTRAVLNDIVDERARQDRKWGVQQHDLPVWMCILTEEVGETSNAILSARSAPNPLRMSAIRRELVQVAAVAVAMIEAIDERRTEAGEWEPGDFDSNEE